MLDLITDRSQRDIDRLKRLRDKAWSTMSASEKAEWYNQAAKGAYNYTDLNRVESAISELSDALLLGLTTKTDWNVWDIPTQSEMNRYLENVVAVTDACPSATPYPTLPTGMNGLTLEGANNIEKALLRAFEIEISIPRCDELFCGEV